MHKLQALKAYRDCGNKTVYIPTCAVAGAERSVSCSSYFIAKECGVFLNFFYKFSECVKYCYHWMIKQYYGAVTCV